MKMSSSLAGALFMLLINAQLTVTWSSIGGVALALAPAPSCKSIECPAYDIIQQGDGYEIRRYNNTLWMSTSPITDISFVNATRTGFLRLFDYIQGQNEEHAKVPMTAPVLTDILPSTGPFCESSFAVSFYVPAKFENAPPKAEESLALEQKRWDVRYAAVRRFGGFVSDYELGEEASKLQVSLSGSPWKPSLSLYSVAQYNSPFEYDGRVNEIWIFVRLHNSSFSSPSSI